MEPEVLTGEDRLFVRGGPWAIHLRAVNMFIGEGEDLFIGWNALQFAPVGTQWVVKDPTEHPEGQANCSATLVWRSSNGALVVTRTWGTTDDANEEWEAAAVEWYDFRSRSKRCLFWSFVDPRRRQ